MEVSVPLLAQLSIQLQVFNCCQVRMKSLDLNPGAVGPKDTSGLLIPRWQSQTQKNQLGPAFPSKLSNPVRCRGLLITVFTLSSVPSKEFLAMLTT